MTTPELPPRYDPKAVEGRLYRVWTDANAFHADTNSSNIKNYCIVIPPPNVTGALHMGHALNNTLQDILTRWKRMQGFNACWVPGTDHASIATHVMVERELKKEGLTRHDLGREKFLERAWAWKEKYGSRIVEQLRQMGCSCDWERLRFTMDEGLSKAVVEHFVRLHEEGLIYRGERIVNWCPRCLTALSDLEVKHADRKGHLWHIRYPLKGGGEVIVATTRPETMLGDTAVAVNPGDARHRAVIGKTAILPLMDREIPVIADEMVAMDFGTGAVKITPAHDPADFDLGRRHKLAVINIMEKNAKLNSNAGSYAGLDRYKAREKVVADLESRGLLVKIEGHTSAVTHCQRCDTVLEPMVSMQWWMRMKELAEPAIRAVELGQRDPKAKGAIQFIPESATAVFYEWMRNIQDWCISRQLWWGHRIPAWHCQKCREATVARSAPAKCPKCGGEVVQDPDILDTWFSSALWPFSTLGWPDKAEMAKLGFSKFYPTTTLVTASDIIFLWVARMIMAGLRLAGNIPFSTVVFNSLITDPEGKKMSKTKGNVVDPLELFDKFGTDAVRFTLTEQESLKQSFRMSEDKVEHGRNFMNKIWNSARFALGEMEVFSPSAEPPKDRSLADRWIVSRLQSVIESSTAALDNYWFNEYTGNLESFFWNEFCDDYIELAKPELKDPIRRPAAQWTLWKCLDTLMRLLHPVVPFITEEIWQRLPRPQGSTALLMLDTWPISDPKLLDRSTNGAEIMMHNILQWVSAVREIRHEQNITPSAPIELQIKADSMSKIYWIKEALSAGYIQTLCRANITLLSEESVPPENSIATVVPEHTIYLLRGTKSNSPAEINRLIKERNELVTLLERIRIKLANTEYIRQAPKQLVEETKVKSVDYETRIARLSERLQQLGK